jgi:hypothetical protein
VTVTASAEPDVSAAGARTLGPLGLQELRGVATDDPMRAVHALPGVATGDDFEAGFSIRGSPFRHAGVTVDGLPAARLLHAVRAETNAGSISMINTDVLSGASLLSGARPARDGDWLGATLAFDLREGSRDRTAGRLALSGTSASMLAEGPLTPGRRGSWLVSVRKSYLDWLVRKVEAGFDSTIGFWDGHVKSVIDLGPADELQLFVIGGDASYRERDVSSPNGLVRAESGGTLAAVSWRHTAASWVQQHRVFFLGSEFRNTGHRAQALAGGYTQEVGWRGDVTVPAAGAWLVEIGGAVSSFQGRETRRRFERAADDDLREQDALETTASGRTSAGWIEARRSSAQSSVAIGVRGASRSGVGALAWSPWLLADRRIGRVRVRAGAGGSIHLADPLVLTAGSARLHERARSADAAVVHDLSPTMEWSVGVFMREESDVYRSAADDRLDPATGRYVPASPFPLTVATLDGRSRGVDIVWRRQAASGITGWAGYTWAHTTMRDTVTGEGFDADFDQRHTLNVVLSRRLSYRASAGIKLRVGSNTPLAGYFEPSADGLRLSSHRNRVRLPAYARLDARATRTFSVSRRRLTLFVEVLNVFNRENVGPADPAVRASLQVTGFAERLVPRVPSAGLVLEF